MILALFDPPSDFEARVRAIRPGAEVVRAMPDDGSYEEALNRAEIVIGRPDPGDLERAAQLSWVQLSSAGADLYVDTVRREVTITAANGVYGIPTSEHALAMMLAMVRRLPASVRAASRKEWEPSLAYDELHGRTCGVLGLGDIGSSIARRAKAFGMRVVALRRRPESPPAYVDALYGREDLLGMLSDCDHVVNALPGTPSTRHLLDARALARMKPTAYLCNIGRGATVDEKALIDALRSGGLAGAALDVFETEPLPPESPLWELPNVLITAHRGGSSPREDERVAELFLENLARRAAGEDLLNVVDRDLGY